MQDISSMDALRCSHSYSFGIPGIIHHRGLCSPAFSAAPSSPPALWRQSAAAALATSAMVTLTSIPVVLIILFLNRILYRG